LNNQVNWSGIADDKRHEGLVKIRNLVNNSGRIDGDAISACRQLDEPGLVSSGAFVSIGSCGVLRNRGNRKNDGSTKLTQRRLPRVFRREELCTAVVFAIDGQQFRTRLCFYPAITARPAATRTSLLESATVFPSFYRFVGRLQADHPNRGGLRIPPWMRSYRQHSFAAM